MKTHLHGQNQPPLPQPPNTYEQTQKQEPDHNHHIPKIWSHSSQQEEKKTHKEKRGREGQEIKKRELTTDENWHKCETKRRERILGFLFEGIERISIQYCVLCLTTRYSQLISISVYYGWVAKKKFASSTKHGFLVLWWQNNLLC